jgi:hypothetical protein
VNRTATRVHQREAHSAFLAGAQILISEHGHEASRPVTSSTVTHSRESIAWGELVEMVTMWRNRYPNQRFYVVQA